MISIIEYFEHDYRTLCNKRYLKNYITQIEMINMLVFISVYEKYVYQSK